MSAARKINDVEQRKIAVKAGKEVSMTAADVYHATGYRFSLLIQEPRRLDLRKKWIN